MAGFTNAASALGEPSRYTPDVQYPSVVSVFSPPFLPEQIVSMGDGGSLTVHFDEPITNDPSHAYGVDLIVYGPAGFCAWGAGGLPDPAGFAERGNGAVEVSADA